MRRLAAVPLADPSQQRARKRRSIATADFRRHVTARRFALEQDAARRCAIWGSSGAASRARRGSRPGLDFVDKAQGYDFYPVQTIQPFAVADSLRRLGTAARPTVTTLDISRRVIVHLREARQRAAQGQAYRVNAVLEQDSAASRLIRRWWSDWRRFGDRVGSQTASEIPLPTPARSAAHD